MDLNNLINKIGIKQKEENKALDRYLENSIENSNKKKEKSENLENLLSRFSKIANNRASTGLWGENETENETENYYNLIYESINDFYFDIKNLDVLDKEDLPVYDVIREDYETNAKFGLFLSALINKNIKNGEEIQLNLPIPSLNKFYCFLLNIHNQVNLLTYI